MGMQPALRPGQLFAYQVVVGALGNQGKDPLPSRPVLPEEARKRHRQEVGGTAERMKCFAYMLDSLVRIDQYEAIEGEKRIKAQLAKQKARVFLENAGL